MLSAIVAILLEWKKVFAQPRTGVADGAQDVPFQVSPAADKIDHLAGDRIH